MITYDDIYYEWLGYRCLYYKHFITAIDDISYDKFEKEVVFKYLGDLCMVDWDGKWTPSARVVDRMAAEQVVAMVTELRQKRFKASRIELRPWDESNVRRIVDNAIESL